MKNEREREREREREIRMEEGKVREIEKRRLLGNTHLMQTKLKNAAIILKMAFTDKGIITSNDI